MDHNTINGSLPTPPPATPFRTPLSIKHLRGYGTETFATLLQLPQYQRLACNLLTINELRTLGRPSCHPLPL